MVELTEKEDKKETNGFKLLRVGNFQSVVQITAGKALQIDHSAKVSQALLKEIYDAGPQYQKWVEAPKGYKAPWQN